MVLLSLLTACGGSDSSGDSNFTKSDTTTDTPDTTDTTDDGTNTGPDTVPEDNVLVALGIGSGSTFQPGVARTGLIGSESLSASGSTTVSVDLVDLNTNNAQFLGLREVSFVSTCTSAGLAEFTPATIKASGTATVTYKDLGCGKEFGTTDNIVVYIAEETENPNATARTAIKVQAAEIGAIQFLSAEPSLIALSGYGAGEVPSLSKLTFQVVDRSGNPMPDRTVKFVLDHEYGGAALSLEKAITGADGSVVVILNAGSAAGTIRVKASVDIKNTAGVVTDTITTMSVPITMATSLGDQNSFSLSATSFNPRSWAYDGATIDLGIRIGDHYQNPVIDGTRVYFRATGGMIGPSCETVDGKCSVTWQGSNPRPVDGYVTIVAYTRGQGDFQDANSNGLFDIGESFTSYEEFYIDANGSGNYETGGAYQPIVDIDGDGIADFKWAADAYRVWVDQDSTGAVNYTIDSTTFFEEFIDTNNNGSYDDISAIKYQGANCSDAAIAAGHCAEQINLKDSVRIQMSRGDSAFIEGPFPWDESLGRYDTNTTLTCIDASAKAGSQNIAWRVADSDVRRNHLPETTSIITDRNDVDVLSSTGVGVVPSTHPVSTFPVWEKAWKLNAGNATKTVADKKYEYLNARGHFITANIIRPETFKSLTGLGAIGINVKTVSGIDISGGELEVDLVGFESTLTNNSFPQLSVNVEGGTSTYTIKVKNRCSQGLPENATLLISLTNGQLDSVTTDGGAGVASIVGNTVSIEIDDATKTAIAHLTISKDSTSDVVPNGLSTSYYVPDGSDVTVYKLTDFDIKD